jgi:DNA-directed RNA polymerase subunit RPC12/RpoP
MPVTERKKNISKIKDKKPYFCPYCKALFTDSTSYKTQEKPLKSYICLICNSEPFNNDTYKEVKNTEDYHIKKNTDKKNVTHFIKRSIASLKKDGYTHREIQEITHFSRSMINNITKIHANATKSMPLDNFFHDELVIDKNDPSNKNILKAIQYGCSYDFICKVFNVSRRDVMQAATLYKNSATAEEKKSTDNFKKSYTILLEKENQVLIKEKK